VTSNINVSPVLFHLLDNICETTYSTAALYVVGTGEATVANNTDSEDSKYKLVSRIVILGRSRENFPVDSFFFLIFAAVR